MGTASREKAGFVALVLALVGSALAFGAQHTSVLVLVSACAAVAALLLGPHRPSFGFWLLLGLAAYTLLQLVPLPLGLLAWLSPSAADVWRGALSPMRVAPPRWGSLSVDPAATTLEAMKWFGYACVLLAASAWRARRSGSGLAAILFGSALAVAIVTLAHGVFEASRIYGLFIPVGNSRWTRGPIVNANPLAGYLNLGLFAGLGLWSARRNGRWERFVPIGVVVLTICVVLTGSRGGVGALVLGGLLFTLLALRQIRFDRAQIALAFGGLVVAAFAVAAAIRGPALWVELADADLRGKVAPWRWSLEMIRDFPVFGAGRGAFETAFQPYRQPVGQDWTTIYAHAENFPLEWIADWGIPVGLVAIGGCLFLARQVLKWVFREPISAGVGLGLGVLFLHNLVDLALEIFAISAAAWVAFAVCSDGSRRETEGPVRWAALPAAGGVLLAAIVALATGATPVKVEREKLERSYKAFVASKSRDPRAIHEELKSAMLRHPGEAYFPLVGALVARRIKRDDPLRWLNRSLERAPMNGTTHLALAQVLAARGARSQAMLHVRLTALYDLTLRDYAYGQAVAWARSTSDLVNVFPRGSPGSELIVGICSMARGEPRVGCWREAVSRNPTDDARDQLARSLLEALEAGQPPCVGRDASACADEAERLSGQLGSTDWRTTYHRARVRAFRGDLKGAAATALDGCPASSEAMECLRGALDFALRSRDLGLASKAAQRYAAVRCGDPNQCAEVHDQIAAGYERLGAWGLALRHYATSVAAEPTTDRWIRNAEAAARAGSSAAARVAVERARGGNPNAEQLERLAAIDELLKGGAR
jgi:O-antigen ligase